MDGDATNNEIQSLSSGTSNKLKMPKLPKIDVHNFKYKISVENVMKLFLLSRKWINKQVHKLQT